MLKSILQNVGLNPQEAIVYLAALKMGTQDATTFAKETGMSRYDVLNAMEKLIELGFISKFNRKKDFFTAESLAVVQKILEAQKAISKNSISSLRKHHELFDAYINPSFVKPEISFYEGKRGIIAAYEDTLTSKTEILALASIDDIETVLPRYLQSYYSRRKTAGIAMKAIFPDTPMARARQAKDQQELRVSRLISADRYFFHIEINIYDNKVAYFSMKEELAIIIKSPAIASSMRQMFDLSWIMAEHTKKCPVYKERAPLIHI